MLYVIGIGSGNRAHLTEEAFQTIEKCDMIVGYKNYLKLVEDLIQDKEIYQNGMKGEVERIEKAVDFAMEGKVTGVISSGDSGIYGMAGLVYEIANKKGYTGEIKVIVGISAFILGAAALGAPIMHDHANISLSDLMTEWSKIEKRIDCAAQSDFIISIYNPKSHGRVDHINRAQEIMLKHKSPDTPVGIVHSAGRENQRVQLATLADFVDYEIDMSSIVIVGNSQTYVENGKMITPRGYEKCYGL